MIGPSTFLEDEDEEDLQDLDTLKQKKYLYLGRSKIHVWLFNTFERDHSLTVLRVGGHHGTVLK